MTSTWFPEPTVAPLRGGPVLRWGIVAPGGIDGDSHEWRDTSGLAMRDGLAWQTTALAGFIAQGRTDSPLHSLEDAISVMRTIDTVRASSVNTDPADHRLRSNHGTSSP
jgi:hypothetical protein